MIAATKLIPLSQALWNWSMFMIEGGGSGAGGGSATPLLVAVPTLSGPGLHHLHSPHFFHG